MSKVKTTSSTPVLADFLGASGTALVINLADKKGYYLDASNVVQELSGGTSTSDGLTYPQVCSIVSLRI